MKRALASVLALSFVWPCMLACSEKKEEPAPEHKHGPHDGIVATFTGGPDGTTTGFIELKLHDDKGDLELWICEDDDFKKPFDLSVHDEVEIEFTAPRRFRISLRARDTKENQDEDGNPNVRDGGTNYFVYPTRESENASWLMGKSFKATVLVRFRREDSTFTSKAIKLYPHSH